MYDSMLSDKWTQQTINISTIFIEFLSSFQNWWRLVAISRRTSGEQDVRPYQGIERLLTLDVEILHNPSCSIGLSTELDPMKVKTSKIFNFSLDNL